jgi:hypothetical protein
MEIPNVMKSTGTTHITGEENVEKFGTKEDRLDMRRMGKEQELNVSMVKVIGI